MDKISEVNEKLNTEDKESRIIINFDGPGRSNFTIDFVNVDASQMFGASEILAMQARSVWAAGQATARQPETPKVIPVHGTLKQ